MVDPAADLNVDPQMGRGACVVPSGLLPWTTIPDDYLTATLENSTRTGLMLLPNFWKRRLQRIGQQAG